MESLKRKSSRWIAIAAVLVTTVGTLGGLCLPELSSAQPSSSSTQIGSTVGPLIAAQSSTDRIAISSAGKVETPSAGKAETSSGGKVATLPPETHIPASHSQSTDVEQRVLIIGSSVASGWHDDASGGGYLRRAFRAYSDLSPNQCTVFDKAIPGAGVMDIVNQYPDWLTEYHPSLVVIAWGGLNDLHRHTPMQTIGKQVEWEIDLALKHKAVVFLVTSPVSTASYTTFRGAQKDLFALEMNTAQGVHSPNVYVFDIYTQTYDYFASHHLPYGPFMADGWHPNALGHELAAELLVDDFTRQFGTKPLVYQAMGRGNV